MFDDLPTLQALYSLRKLLTDKKEISIVNRLIKKRNSLIIDVDIEISKHDFGRSCIFIKKTFDRLFDEKLSFSNIDDCSEEYYDLQDKYACGYFYKETFFLKENYYNKYYELVLLNYKMNNYNSENKSAFKQTLKIYIEEQLLEIIKTIKL
jgi:hypothetical protein